jgi:perosamine synthetase
MSGKIKKEGRIMIEPFKVHMPLSVKDELLKTLFSGYIGQGEKVEEFEKKFSDKFGIKNVISVNNGTSALRLALTLCGVKPGDEVISTPYTAVATNTAILEQFAKPVFADVQYETANINPESIRKKITKETKCIICVHWGGYPCDMEEIREIAKEHNIPVIEDACEALGSEYKGEKIGNISEYTCFSFQAIKHITTGDGGMLVVKDKDKYEEGIRRRWYGIDRKKRDVDITEAGFKYHMNDITATIGIEQLNYFDKVFNRRKEIVNMYREGLKDLPNITLLENKKDRINANWMFAVHVENREKFMDYMKCNGIMTVVHNKRNDAYSVFGGPNKDLVNLEKLDKTLVNIPLHHALTDEEVHYVIDKIKCWKC